VRKRGLLVSLLKATACLLLGPGAAVALDPEFAFEFGASDLAISVGGIATDADGNIWVADTLRTGC
jgi:hypothetical protein